MQISTNQLYLIQIAALVLVPYGFWRFSGLRKIAPLAVVQIVFGLLVGPAVLGQLAPDFFKALFTSDSLVRISGVATVAVVLYTFLTGMHLDIAEVSATPGIRLSAAGSFLIPLASGAVLGYAIAQYLPDMVGKHVNVWQFSFAIGILISVTALPVLAALLKEIGMLHTPIGQQAMGIAAINDACLWTALSILLVSVSGSSGHWSSIAFLPVYLAAMVGGFLLLRRLGARYPESDGERATLMLVCGAALAFLSAFVADKTGLGYVFGAFLGGIVIPHQWRAAMIAKLETVVAILLMPFFFILTGLRTQADWSSSALLVLTVLATVTAIGSKVIGVMVPAFITGSSLRYAARLGVLLQTKGLMEVIVLTQMLDAGAISSGLFSVFILVAVICTTLSAPVVQWLEHRRTRPALQV